MDRARRRTMEEAVEDYLLRIRIPILVAAVVVDYSDRVRISSRAAAAEACLDRVQPSSPALVLVVSSDRTATSKTRQEDSLVQARISPTQAAEGYSDRTPATSSNNNKAAEEASLDPAPTTNRPIPVVVFSARAPTRMREELQDRYLEQTRRNSSRPSEALQTRPSSLNSNNLNLHRCMARRLSRSATWDTP